jgi:hypothetical protein
MPPVTRHSFTITFIQLSLVLSRAADLSETMLFRGVHRKTYFPHLLFYLSAATWCAPSEGKGARDKVAIIEIIDSPWDYICAFSYYPSPSIQSIKQAKKQVSLTSMDVRAGNSEWEIPFTHAPFPLFLSFVWLMLRGRKIPLKGESTRKSFLKTLSNRVYNLETAT